MITLQLFNELFPTLQAVLVSRHEFSEAAKAAYYRAVASKLNDQEFIAACDAAMVSDTFLPAPARLIELGQLSRPQPIFIAPARDPESDFRRMNPEQQRQHLEAIEHARKIALEGIAKAPKPVAGFGSIGEGLAEELSAIDF